MKKHILLGFFFRTFRNDGCNRTTAFAHSTDLACEGNVMFLRDVGAGHIKFAAPKGPFQEHLKHVNKHGILGYITT